MYPCLTDISLRIPIYVAGKIIILKPRLVRNNMKRIKLKYRPQIILLWVARNYLNEAEFKRLLDSLYKCNRDKLFLHNFLKNFDVELLRTKPIIWQDIWIYNYLTYDCKEKLTKTQQLLNYEKEFIIPTEETLKELKNIL